MILYFLGLLTLPFLYFLYHLGYITVAAWIYTYRNKDNLKPSFLKFNILRYFLWEWKNIFKDYIKGAIRVW